MAFALGSFYNVGPNAGLTRQWRYSTTDSATVVETANYFLAAWQQLSIGDNILVNYMTGSSVTTQVEYLITAATASAATIRVTDGYALTPQDFGAVGNGTTDDLVALRAWLAAPGRKYGSPGRYRHTGSLSVVSNTTIECAVRGGGTGGCILVPDYSGSGYPLSIDGPLGTGWTFNDWVYDVTINGLYIDASNWTGSSTHVVNLDNCFSTSINLSVDSCPPAKKNFKVGTTNDVVLNKVRIYGNAGTPVVGIDVTSVNGPVNGLSLHECDVEVCDSGIVFTGTTHTITADIIRGYYEACDIYVDWNSSNVESNLTILGGNMIQKALSTGVKIQQSNCTIVGLKTNGAGTYSVDMVAGSNCHIIGGNLRATINDPSKLLVTNSFKAAVGSATYNPPNLADGQQQLVDVNVPGATLGQFARASFSLDLLGISLTAHVSAADTVRCVFQNETGGALDIASGTLRVRVD